MLTTIGGLFTTQVVDGATTVVVLATPMHALDQAIEIAGGQTALARLINKRQGHVAVWKARGKVPAEAVIAIEAATGVSREALRPDLYPAKPKRAA